MPTLADTAPEGLIPEPDDRTYVWTGDALLVSGTYTFGNHLKVTRYAGPTNPLGGGGPLVHASVLIADQLAGANAALTILAWGVKSGSAHQVYFNGEYRGILRSTSACKWSSTTFTIPLGLVNFPGERPPVDEPNEIEIVVEGQPECLRFRAAWLKVRLISPIVLIHGNKSDGGFFVRQGFTLPVYGGLVDQNLLFDNSILLDPNPTDLSANQLHSLIHWIVRSFGVDSVHLVAHSKGGLDVREYLDRLYPKGACQGGATEGEPCKSHAECGAPPARCKRPFDVLSLTTLSTPHNGTVLADLAIKRQKAVATGAILLYSGFPSMAQPIAYLNSWISNPGLESLSTDTCAAFNDVNTRFLTRDIVYNTVAADADCNGNGGIDWTNEEEWVTAPYEDFAAYPTVLDPLYRILRTTAQVTLGFVPDAADGHSGWVTIYAVPNGVQYDNDTLVTTRSGLGTGSFATLRTESGGQSALLRAGACRNHASVANHATAQIVGQWIIATERSRGDLR